LQAQILAAGGPLWTLAECESYIRMWFEIFSGVLGWMGLQHSRAQRYGMVWTALGRWRLVSEAMSAVPRVRSAGLRQAGNHPIQGTAGDQIKLAMAEIMPLVHYYRHTFRNCTCLPILQIHDELVFELSPDIARDFLEESRAIMVGSVRPMDTPVRASIAIAEDWAGLK
jgi:DNA polymerase-1